MKIAIITLTTTARRTGVAEYLINLIDELQRSDKHNQYFIFTATDNRYMFSLTGENFKEIRLPIKHDPGFIMRPIFHFWQIFILPFWCKWHGIDVVHLPNTLFVSGLYPTVSTIHDVVELKTKKYSPFRTRFRKVMVNSSIRNAKRIITVSESSANDLKALGAKTVIPIHLGFKNPYDNFSNKNEKEILQRHNLSVNPYVLFIGTMLKHKNIPVLIEAFNVAKKTVPDLKLVLIGAPDNDHKNVTTLVTALNLAEDVFMLNYVTQEEKLVILKNAKVFCLISSYEGFGIPILEAQAAGVPVIANNISSLPEVGGEGIFLASPENLKEETALGLVKLLTDQPARVIMINKGYENINRFSWSEFARKTLNVYLELSHTK